jgi:hypothetical protein
MEGHVLTDFATMGLMAVRDLDWSSSWLVCSLCSVQDHSLHCLVISTLCFETIPKEVTAMHLLSIEGCILFGEHPSLDQSSFPLHMSTKTTLGPRWVELSKTRSGTTRNGTVVDRRKTIVNNFLLTRGLQPATIS